MKKIRGEFILLFVSIGIFLAVSCSTSPKNSSSSNGGTTTSSSPGGASTTIAALPDLKLKNVPDSLASGSDLKLKSMPAYRIGKTFRNVGDVTNFNPAGLPDVKAQGWIDMRSQIKNTPIMGVMDFIKSYASNHTIPYDTDIQLGSAVVAGAPMPKAAVKVHQASDSEMDIYIVASIDPMGQGTYQNMPMFLKVVTDSSSNVNVDFITKFSGMESSAQESITMSVIYYSHYNQVSNENLNFTSFSASGTVQGFTIDQTGWTINRIYPYSGGGMVLLTYDLSSSSNSVNTNLSIAWGDNSMGGVISKNYSAYSDGAYSGTNTSIYTEYYNDSGSLVFKNWGELTPPDTSWMNSYTNYGKNLKDLGFTSAPESIVVINDWSSGWSNVVSVSLTNGTAVIVPNDVWNFYYKQNPSSWSSGDAVYWYDSSTYDNTNNRYFETMKKGYSVPSASFYLDNNYYVQNSWPMKYLTLQQAYSNYTITRKENYSYSYTNINIWTNLSGAVVTNNDIWNWADFDWWLAKTPDTNPDPTNDIRLQNIDSYDVYIWNGTNMDKEKGLFVYGSDVTPKYFDFSASGIVSGVDTKINTIYSANSFSLTTFTNSLIAMPASNLFPVLQ